MSQYTTQSISKFKNYTIENGTERTLSEYFVSTFICININIYGIYINVILTPNVQIQSRTVTAFLLCVFWYAIALSKNDRKKLSNFATLAVSYLLLPE